VDTSNIATQKIQDNNQQNRAPQDQRIAVSSSKARGRNNQMEFNHIEKEDRNDLCQTCKGNKIMMHWLQQYLKDLRSEMRMEYSFQKKNIVSQKEEIMALKTKCKHLEEVVEY